MKVTTLNNKLLKATVEPGDYNIYEYYEFQDIGKLFFQQWLFS